MIKTLEEHVVLKTPFVTVYNNHVEFANGARGHHFAYDNGGGSAVLPVQRDGRVRLISNTKYGYILAGKDYPVVETPRGRGEPGENRTQAAHRELLEESGLISSVLISIASGVVSDPSIGIADADLYIGWCCHQTTEEHEIDPTEAILAQHDFTLLELKELLLDGQIKDVMTGMMVGVLLQGLSHVPLDLLEGRSGAFLLGVWNARTGSIHQDPFRNRADCGQQAAEWEEGYLFGRLHLD